MNQSNRKTPFTLILYFIIGAGTAAFAFWLFDHPRSMPGSGIMIAVSLGYSLCLHLGAFSVSEAADESSQQI